MTPKRIAELLALIQGDPQLKALADAGNDSALATALTSSLPVIPKPKTFLGERGIYDLLGVTEGETFLQTVEALATTDGEFKSTFARVDRWLKDGIGIDVGSVRTQEMLSSFVPTFNAESVGKIIAFGSQPQVITTEDVFLIVASTRTDGRVGA